MDATAFTDLERMFSSLPSAEREKIIRHGAALRMINLRQRLFLAESKMRSFAERYQTTLEQLEDAGLPDDASLEMHEDYIQWRHWVAVVCQVTQDINALQLIVHQGIPGEAPLDAGD